MPSNDKAVPSEPQLTLRKRKNLAYNFGCDHGKSFLDFNLEQIFDILESTPQ